MIIEMDIVAQTKKLIYATLTGSTCEGMNDNERVAYEMGVKNTLSVLKAILETGDNEYVVHVPGKENIEEYCI